MLFPCSYEINTYNLGQKHRKTIENNQTLFIEKYNKDDLYNSFGNNNYYNKSFYNADGSVRRIDSVHSATNKNRLDSIDFNKLLNSGNSDG